jgi:nanoRNase/pAp phosphatase (c-di-AMP/oligoRNAs hydrolase)
MIRPIRRLNNKTMVKLLRLPLSLITKVRKKEFTKFVLVDGQPSHNEVFGRFNFTAVIDHHPVAVQLPDIPFVDIRPEFGATSTIMAGYLRAACVKPSRTLATTLLYGIKTDTRNFERHTIPEDIEVFRDLFSHADRQVLSKVEISDLSIKDLRFFHKAFERKHVIKNRIFAHLDEVTTADILVEIAEFFLKVHDIFWSIVSGVFQDHLIIVIRNGGYQKDAGKVARKAFGSIGCAGGHEAMARAEIPMKKLADVLGHTGSSTSIDKFIEKQLSPFF